MTRFSFLAVPLLVSTLGATAVAAPPSLNETLTKEEAFFRGAMMFCMTPVINREDIAALADRESLIALAEQDALRLDPNGGHAFALPPHTQEQTLVTRPGVGCSVTLKQADPQAFWQRAAALFGEGTPFHMLDEAQTDDGKTLRIYSAEMNGPVTVYLSLSPEPSDDTQPQGMITITRLFPDAQPPAAPVTDD